jgi:hypothetical protein
MRASPVIALDKRWNKYDTKLVRTNRRNLEHLAISHLDRKEDHGEGRKPDTTSSKPENTRAFCGE